MEKRIFNAEWENQGHDEMRALQFDRLKRLLEKVWAENEFYREHWQAKKVDLEKIGTIADFTAMVPTVEKKDFMADQALLPPYGRRHRHVLELDVPLIITNTSGTSGQGVEIHMQTAQEFETTKHIYGYLMRWSGLKRADKVFLTMPITMMTGGRAEYHGAEGNGLSVFAVGNYDAQKKLELMERFRPRALLGTTSYFGHLGAAATNPEALGTSVLLTGGEGAGFPWFERLEDTWNGKVFDRYGSTQSRNDHAFSCEVGIGSASRPAMLHNIDPLVLLEVIDPATGKHVKDGEMGEIVITSLYHVDTPLIRCRMRDRGVWHQSRYCSCGRPFCGLEAASIGRLDDMKKVKGVNIWPSAVDSVMFIDPMIDDYQVVLASNAEEADLATIRVMPKEGISGDRAESFRKVVAERVRLKIGINFAVEILPPGALARSEWKAKRWVDERIHAQR